MDEPSRVLLDTTVLIDLELLDFGDYSTMNSAISTITVAELAYGLDTSDPVERLARSERFYTVLRLFAILPFDLRAAKLYGALATLTRQAGRDPRPRRLDLQIAATAAANSMPMLTTNIADFTGLERLVEVVALTRKA